MRVFVDTLEKVTAEFYYETNILPVFWCLCVRFTVYKINYGIMFAFYFSSRL